MCQSEGLWDINFTKMPNSISIIMLGLVVAVCVFFMLKSGRVQPADNQDQKWLLVLLVGVILGAVFGGVLGVPIAEWAFKMFDYGCGLEALGLWLLSVMFFMVMGGLCAFPVYHLFKKRA